MGTPLHAPDAVDFSRPIDRDHARRIGRAWVELRRGAWTAALRDHLYGDDHPLEQGQMDALDLLVRGDRTMKGLAERLRIEPSSATRAVQRLVADGLAERVPSPDDGRVVMVRATDLGRARHAEVDQRRADAMAGILGVFSREERAELASLLERMVESLDRVGTELANRSAETR